MLRHDNATNDSNRFIEMIISTDDDIRHTVGPFYVYLSKEPGHSAHRRIQGSKGLNKGLNKRTKIAHNMHGCSR